MSKPYLYSKANFIIEAGPSEKEPIRPNEIFRTPAGGASLTG